MLLKKETGWEDGDGDITAYSEKKRIEVYALSKVCPEKRLHAIGEPATWIYDERGEHVHNPENDCDYIIDRALAVANTLDVKVTQNCKLKTSIMNSNREAVRSTTYQLP